jgi:hypothetical protein
MNSEDKTSVGRKKVKDIGDLLSEQTVEQGQDERKRTVRCEPRSTQKETKRGRESNGSDEACSPYRLGRNSGFDGGHMRPKTPDKDDNKSDSA